jgi:hypothetical protein
MSSPIASLPCVASPRQAGHDRRLSPRVRATSQAHAASGRETLPHFWWQRPSEAVPVDGGWKFPTVSRGPPIAPPIPRRSTSFNREAACVWPPRRTTRYGGGRHHMAARARRIAGLSGFLTFRRPVFAMLDRRDGSIR